MINVHVDIRLKEKQVILSPISKFSVKEEKTLSDLGYRKNIHGNFLSGYDTYNLTKGLLNASESSGLVSYLQNLQEASKGLLNRVESYLENECPFKLYEFQKEFVRWFNNPLKTRTSVLNCSECGLGKTLMSLAAVLSVSPDTSLYILCPKNAIGNWIDHLNRFGYKLPIHVGKFTPEKNGGCCILTYESLNPTKNEANEKKRFIEDFFKEIPQSPVIIADEFHKCKNASTKMTKRFRKLFNLVKRRNGKCIALTATPIMSYESDLKVLLTNLDLLKCTFGNAEVFNELYGGEFNWETKRFTWDPDKRKPVEIKQRLSNVMFIKKKKDVITQLPEITETDIILDLEISKDDRALLSVLNSDNKNDLKTYQKIRSTLSMAKLNRALETIEDFEQQEKPILVFSDFKSPIEKLGKRKGWKFITGDVSPEDRQSFAKEMNEGKLKGLAITIGAGSTALNIPGTDTALFIDLSLTVGNNEQAKGRNDRINKPNEKLHYIYFITDHPFERAMYANLKAKKHLTDDTLGDL